jgi:hypothetical protein
MISILCDFFNKSIYINFKITISTIFQIPHFKTITLVVLEIGIYLAVLEFGMYWDFLQNINN